MILNEDYFDDGIEIQDEHTEHTEEFDYTLAVSNTNPAMKFYKKRIMEKRIHAVMDSLPFISGYKIISVTENAGTLGDTSDHARNINHNYKIEIGVYGMPRNFVDAMKLTRIPHMLFNNNISSIIEFRTQNGNHAFGFDPLSYMAILSYRETLTKNAYKIAFTHLECMFGLMFPDYDKEQFLDYVQPVDINALILSSCNVRGLVGNVTNHDFSIFTEDFVRAANTRAANTRSTNIMPTEFSCIIGNHIQYEGLKKAMDSGYNMCIVMCDFRTMRTKLFKIDLYHPVWQTAIGYIKKKKFCHSGFFMSGHYSPTDGYCMFSYFLGRMMNDIYTDEHAVMLAVIAENNDEMNESLSILFQKQVNIDWPNIQK